MTPRKLVAQAIRAGGPEADLLAEYLTGARPLDLAEKVFDAFRTLEQPLRGHAPRDVLVRAWALLVVHADLSGDAVAHERALRWAELDLADIPAAPPSSRSRAWA